MENTNLPELYEDSRKAEFIDFLSAPRQLRGMNQKRFAKKIGVTPQTLSEWKKLPGFKQEVAKQVKLKTAEHTPDIIEALAAKAKKGDVQAIRLWLQYVHDWSERQATNNIQFNYVDFIGVVSPQFDIKS